MLVVANHGTACLIVFAALVIGIEEQKRNMNHENWNGQRIWMAEMARVIWRTEKNGFRDCCDCVDCTAAAAKASGSAVELVVEMTAIERVDSSSLVVAERHFATLALAAVVEEHMFVDAKE